MMNELSRLFNNGNELVLKNERLSDSSLSNYETMKRWIVYTGPYTADK